TPGSDISNGAARAVVDAGPLVNCARICRRDPAADPGAVHERSGVDDGPRRAVRDVAARRVKTPRRTRTGGADRAATDRPRAPLPSGRGAAGGRGRLARALPRVLGSPTQSTGGLLTPIRDGAIP